MTETTAAGYLLPDTADATIRAEWHITPSTRVHPDAIAPRTITDRQTLDAELVEWREDVRSPAVWQRVVITWPSGAVFVDAWSLSGDEVTA